MGGGYRWPSLNARRGIFLHPNILVPQPGTRSQKNGTRNPKYRTRNPKYGSRNPKYGLKTRNMEPGTRTPNTRNPEPNTTRSLELETLQMFLGGLGSRPAPHNREFQTPGRASRDIPETPIPKFESRNSSPEKPEIRNPNPETQVGLVVMFSMRNKGPAKPVQFPGRSATRNPNPETRTRNQTKSTH